MFGFAFLLSSILSTTLHIFVYKYIQQTGVATLQQTTKPNSSPFVLDQVAWDAGLSFPLPVPVLEIWRNGLAACGRIVVWLTNAFYPHWNAAGFSEMWGIKHVPARLEVTVFEYFWYGHVVWQLSWESKGTPPMPHPPRNKGLTTGLLTTIVP